MNSWIIKNIIFPIYQIKLKKDEKFRNSINFYKKTEGLDRSSLYILQLKRLKRVLNHCDQHVPYYHKLFKKQNFNPKFIKNTEELKKIPILTKEIINENFEDFIPTNYNKNDLIPSSTGGSTGKPFRFYIDKKWRACNMGAANRSWSWADYKLGDKMAYLWGARQDIEKDNTLSLRNMVLRKIKLNAFNMDEDLIKKYVRILIDYNPKFINAYASAIYNFSELANKKSLEKINPHAILTTADMLLEHQRKKIEENFNCDVFDYYSARDTTFQAAECNEHSGYHMSIENAVVEFIKDNCRVNNGETGKIIITDLCNYAMPLIRYEIGDMGTYSDEECACGRSLPLIKTLKGRILDRIITPDGKIITGEFFPALFADYKINSIKEYQIIQKSKEKLLIKIVKRDGYDDSGVNLFIKLIKQYVGDSMVIEIKIQKIIQPSSSGKNRPVICEI